MDKKLFKNRRNITTIKINNDKHCRNGEQWNFIIFWHWSSSASRNAIFNNNNDNDDLSNIALQFRLHAAARLGRWLEHIV